MFRPRWLALSLLLALAVPGHAAEKKHPIDRALEACLEKNGSTAGMVECTEKALKQWDAELNRVYSALLKALPAERAAALKQAQREWLAFRDAEFKSIGALYGGMQGTMYIPMSVHAQLQVVRTRALALAGYLELVLEQ